MKVSDAIKLVEEFRHNLDLDVRFSNGDTYRIVAFYNKEKKDVVLITNISREKMRASLITDIQNSVAAYADIGIISHMPIFKKCR